MAINIPRLPFLALSVISLGISLFLWFRRSNDAMYFLMAAGVLAIQALSGS